MPPEPTDPMVYLNEIKSMTVGVISFDGFGEDDVVISKASELNKLLAQTGLYYDRNNWFFAGYDPPFRVNNRHNEVWIQIYNDYDALSAFSFGRGEDEVDGLSTLINFWWVSIFILILVAATLMYGKGE